MNTNEDTPEARGKAMGIESAYPGQEMNQQYGTESARPGMTKREVIAMHVMAGLIAEAMGSTRAMFFKDIATAAIGAADALLVALNE